MDAIFTTPPKNKAELIRRIQAARVELEDFVGKLEPAALTKPGLGGGWSVLDHLVHLAEWRWKALAMIQGRPGYEGLKIDAQTYQTTGLDGINAILYKRNRNLPAEEKLEAFRKSNEAVLDAIQNLDEATLQRAYDLHDLSDERVLLEGIIGNTYDHDLQHLGWIKEMV